MSDYPGNFSSPDGTYTERGLDLAVWREGDGNDHGEWELCGYLIPDLPAGRKRLAAKRKSNPHFPADYYRLVHVIRATTISDLGE